MTRTHYSVGIRAIGLVLAIAAGAAWSQPDRDGRPERDAARERPPASAQPFDAGLAPERMRARLANLLTELESSAERVRGAIALLDDGKGVGEVIEALGGPARVRMLAEAWGQWRRPEGGPSDGAPVREPGEPPFAQDIPPERVLAFLRDNAPEMGERLGRLRQDDPEQADRYLMRFAPRVSEIAQARERDPEFAQFKVQEFRLGMRMLEAGRRYQQARREGDEPAIEQARAELRDLAAAQVDLKLKQREHEIANLAGQIERLKADVDRQRGERDQLIEEMVDRAGRGRSRRGGDRSDRGGPDEDGQRRDRRGTDRDGG